MTTEVQTTTITGTKVNSNVQTTKDAFANFKIDSSDFLRDVDERTICPKCRRSRKFFCYTCFIVVCPALEGRIPSVTLPIQIDIIKHPGEVDGKSTSTHGKILSPNIQIYVYPDLPDTSNSVVVFPGNGAEVAEAFFECHKVQNNGVFPFKNIIFIDSTWNQTYRIVSDPKIARLPKIILKGTESLFWRYQRGNPTTYLATIEAIYYVCKIYHEVFVNEEYNGEYDNLLFFFKYMFKFIRERYGAENLKTYATRPYLQNLEY